MGATYRFAFDQERRVHDAYGLTHDMRKLAAPFTCVGCGGDMVARLGAIRVRHFAHRVEGACAPETYLHRLAKSVFVSTFRACVEKKEPFILKCIAPGCCRHFQQSLGFECSKNVAIDINLSQVFDDAVEEAPHNGFRADVLLRSARSPKTLMMEFVVAHECDKMKLDSGLPIVEVFIADERDALSIAGATLGTESPRTVVHNFQHKKTRDVDCKGQCKREVLVFIVHESGKCILRSAIPAEAVELLQRGAAHAEVIGFGDSDLDLPELFRLKVRDQSLRGFGVRNCYACRHHGVGNLKAVFCLEKRRDVESNDAADCDRFSRLPSTEAHDAVDRRNRSFIDKRHKWW